MLIFTSLLLFLRTNTGENFYSVAIVNDMFTTDFVSRTDVTGVESFLDDVGFELLASADGKIPQIRGLSVIVNPIRLRAQRTKKIDCPRNVKTSVEACYAPEYNDDTKSTDTIGTGAFPWSVYKTEDETRIHRTTEGELSSYDGGGYILDFDPMQTYETWKEKLAEVKENKFYDSSMRSLFITFTIFNPSTSDWVACEYLYEFSTMGLVIPSHGIVRPFKPNIFETGSEKGLRAADFLRFFLSIYILAVLFVKRIFQMKSLSKLFTIKMVVQLASDLLVVALVITIFSLAIVLSDESTQKVLDSKEYVDFVQKGYWFSVIFILESYLFLVILLKIVFITSVFKTMKIISMSFGIAMKQLLAYALIMFPILA